MGRSSAIVRLVFIFIIGGLIGAWSGCSSSSPTRNTEFPVPANIVLSPSNNVSLDVGSMSQTFTATAQDNKKAAITTPISFFSNNTAVLTISASGLACAGTWDSLSAPQICTPGPVGVAQVTATSHGVSSPPTTVYVHQHIDKIVVTPVPDQTPPADPCFSKGQIFNYQATAFSRGLDITSSVGTFTWQSVNSDVATLDVATDTVPVSGLVTGQVKVTAHTPGVTSLFVGNSNVTSQPLPFSTCAVQSITLAVNGSSTNSITVTQGAAGIGAVTATVVDTANTTITGVPLTWSSSEPATLAVSTAGVITTTQAGGGTVVASCTPPTCNIGIKPLLPIYPTGAVDVVITPTATTTTATTTPTVFVTSTGISSSPAGNCATTTGCVSLLIPISTPNNSVGAAIGLPATPNSLVFDHQGAKAYMGTDYSFFGSRGLMVATAAIPPTLTQFRSVTGKVLAVSPDGKKVILSGADPNAVPVPGSNTPPPPTQVIVFDTTGGTGTTLPIAGATAADFSPDNLRAFIVAGSNLYVYSTQDALKQIVLSAPANAVSMAPEGAFVFLSGGSSASSVTAFNTCGLTSALTNEVLPGTPSFLKALARDATNLVPPLTPGANTTSVLAVDSPGIDLFRVARTPVGCSSAASSGAATSFNLGQGNFVPVQLIVSQDQSRAFVIANNRGSVLVFNIDNQTSSAIPLLGDVIPIQASLTPDGSRLYIAAADGQVHILDTQTGGDVQQISFITDATTLQAGLCGGVTFTCNPDLIAVKP